MTNKPGVSIVIATFNAKRTLNQCLACIAEQKYPRSQMEVLIVDGGSRDSTLDIAKSFKSKIPIKIIHGGMSDNMEGRRLVGFRRSKFDIICALDSDNYMGGSNWIQRLVNPLEQDPEIVGSFTLHYHYDPKQTLFNRYVAFFGGHDPVSYYLGKTDRLKWTTRTWNRSSQIVSEFPKYTKVQFSSTNFPTLGCNGFMIRKSFLRLKNLSAEEFFHTDILYDLLPYGLNNYAVVDAPLTHDTGSTLIYNLKKRILYMSLHHIRLIKFRRYKVFDASSLRDIFRLGVFLVFAITIIEPTVEAIWGYFKVRDKAWFLHPIVCVFFLFGYSYAFFKAKVGR